MTAIAMFLFGWLLIPSWWHVVAALILGSVLGARFGWLAPISLGLSVLVAAISNRRLNKSDGGRPYATETDFTPPLGRVRPYKKGETAADRWRT